MKLGYWVSVGVMMAFPLSAMAEEPTGLAPRSPITCNKTDRLTIENARIDAAGPAIMISGACEVTIKNSEIRSLSVALMVSGGGKLHIENSLIIAPNATMASGGARIHMAGSRVYGKQLAMSVSGGAHVELVDSRIFGSKRVSRSAAVRSDKKTVWSRYRKPKKH